ncbi:unnamed protein product [Paramecium pentaurelia]|uniref:Peptidase M14 domain-containing protein n=1 Tax=Paramecium pentaurelia TaxID=43138 RepID=A0A8S1VIN7_9CILI|nr:unnamed protein product [Paramecium pentaurelia]
MGNKQSNEKQMQESQISQNQSQLSSRDSQISSSNFTNNKIQKQVLLNQELIYPSSDDCPSKINVTLNGITFWSNYDSGNLSQVEQIEATTFNLSISEDCQGRIPPVQSNKGTRQWFNFKVVSVTDFQANFVIVNIATRFKKIWTNDSDIYVKINKIWSRYPAVYQGFQVKFSFEFKANQIVQFAYMPPWSYKKNQKFFDFYFSQLHPDIYFRRETIAYSLEGRNIELITITKNGPHEQQEYYCPEFLFPDKQQNESLIKFKKQYILISCRVHAGEVPASFILKGILESLQNYNESAKFLLENYVFLIIPMLNPDGVYRGHYRLDSLGYDQNRVYNRILKFPKFNGPLAVLETCKNYNVAFYIDLHAHSVLSNSFIYTNWHPDPSIHQAILEFPKQMKSKVAHFRIKEAMSTQINYEKNQYEIEGIYTEKEENIQKAPELKIHFTKENLVPQSMNDDCPYSINPYLTGVAKSDVYLTTQVMFSYTLEVNYRFYTKNKQVFKYEITDFITLGRDVIESLYSAHQNQDFIQIKQHLDSNILN